MHSTLDHPVEEPALDSFEEQVQVAQGFQRWNDQYLNTYNPRWRNHPNFSWKSQPPQNALNNMPYRNNLSNQQDNYREQPSIQPPIQPRIPPPIEQPIPVPSSLESMMAQMLQTMQEQKADINTRFQDLEQNTQLLHSHSQSISKLETQIGQIAEAINRREQGQLPSQVIGNTSGSSQQKGFFEQAKAVMTLRSGRELIRPEREVKFQGREEENLGRDQAKESESEPLVDSSVQRPGKEKVGENEPSPASYIPRAPFPQYLEPPNVPTTRKSARMEEMIELFKQENVSAVVSNRIPPKLKDPGAPSISCVIGNVTINRALLDLRASVNLLPTSVYEQFNLGELKSTEVILQLANQSVKMPRGLIEDVFVKVEELYFPVDFLVLDMEYTRSGSMPLIILKRPFLAMANACISCRSREMEVSFGNRKLRLNVFNVGLGPMREDDNECFMVDAIDSLVEAHAPQMSCDDAIYTLMNLFVEEICSLSVVSEI
ncbi:uncharacterized protein LOC116128893 [Pistacia vera]|uniref:uncharacterized protein LOC116128893 n=1 Tax=Pistacia vera TaxID=55513 RepID=UPI001262B04D|nr:uncharacterized protein LOC116128893 [Pistacia vera]